jgi:uncharacterized membrane protein YjjP (DUF1212 family)
MKFRHWLALSGFFLMAGSPFAALWDWWVAVAIAGFGGMLVNLASLMTPDTAIGAKGGDHGR